VRLWPRSWWPWTAGCRRAWMSRRCAKQVRCVLGVTCSSRGVIAATSRSAAGQQQPGFRSCCCSVGRLGGDQLCRHTGSRQGTQGVETVMLSALCRHAACCCHSQDAGGDPGRLHQPRPSTARHDDRRGADSVQRAGEGNFLDSLGARKGMLTTGDQLMRPAVDACVLMSFAELMCRTPCFLLLPCSGPAAWML
jgi:hypothetical protein